MKTQRKLNVLIVVLIVILLSVISFGGIYYKNKNQMKNVIPNYAMGEDLKGYRQVTLKVKEGSSSEISTTDSANEISLNEITNEIVDASIDDTKSKYEKVASIFRKRLKSLSVQNYTVSIDDTNGEVVFKLPENDQTDVILSDIAEKGQFTIKDKETSEVLLDNSDIKSVDIGLSGLTAATSKIYMSINFNASGTRKFAKITENYQNTIAENTTTKDVSVDDLTNAIATNEIANTESTDESEKKESKEVVISIDDSEMLSTYFSSIIDNGVLTLTLASGDATGDNTTQLYSAYNLKAILENDALPVDYEISNNAYISSEYNENQLKIIIYVEIAICLLIALVLIAKYRTKGILLTILSVGYLAILLVVLRFTNVIFSLPAIMAVAVDVIMSLIFGFMLSKSMNKNLTDKEKLKISKEVILKYTFTIIPIFIISIICCLNSWGPISSLGMVTFWGTTINWLYNFIVCKLFLK